MLFLPTLQSVIGRKCFLKYDNINGVTQQIVHSSNYFNQNESYYFLTNNEINMLSIFLNNIITDTDYAKYKILLYIQNDMFYNDNIIERWINNIYFFKNVQSFINNYLFIKKYNYVQYNKTTDTISFSNTLINNITFNGTEILFNNLAVPYITNEFTYSRSNNIVYRSLNNYTINIQKQIYNFINKINNTNKLDIYFGVSINLLLKYLDTLGSDYNNYINKTTLDVFNYEPVKYIMNLINSNYKFNNSPILTSIIDTSNILNNINTISSIAFTQSQQLIYNGLYSLNNYNNNINPINNIYNYNPINIITKKLQNIDILHDFKLVFNNNIIRSDCSYSLYYYKHIFI